MTNYDVREKVQADLPDTSPCYWWLSFVDRTGDDHGGTVACQLGVCIVFCGGDIGDDVDEAWTHHCNPGGEVMGFRLPDIKNLPRRFTYRLFTDEGDITEAQIVIGNASTDV
jgi:hypothetical protein